MEEEKFHEDLQKAINLSQRDSYDNNGNRISDGNNSGGKNDLKQKQ